LGGERHFSYWLGFGNFRTFCFTPHIVTVFAHPWSHWSGFSFFLLCVFILHLSSRGFLYPAPQPRPPLHPWFNFSRPFAAAVKVFSHLPPTPFPAVVRRPVEFSFCCSCGVVVERNPPSFFFLLRTPFFLLTPLSFLTFAAADFYTSCLYPRYFTPAHASGLLFAFIPLVFVS